MVSSKAKDPGLGTGLAYFLENLKYHGYLLTKTDHKEVSVKNRFSDLTKEKEGRDRPRKDVMNRHQAKALREGCRERKEAQTGVSSREKMNTNKNLARATTKSKSKTQTVSNGHVGRGGRDGGFKEHPNVRDLIE